MTTTTLHPLAADYLKRLSRAGRRLPRARRQELLTEIEAHLTEAIEPAATEAQVRTVLERLGDPDEIIEAETPGRSRGQRTRGAQEWAAIFLILFGGYFFGIGWLIGLILLWSSEAWTTRDKLIGTLIIPGGLGALPIVLLSVSTTSSGVCTSPIGGAAHCTNTGDGANPFAIAGIILLVLAPIATAIYLAKRAN